jgi:hypothetical protein
MLFVTPAYDPADSSSASANRSRPIASPAIGSNRSNMFVSCGITKSAFNIVSVILERGVPSLGHFAAKRLARRHFCDKLVNS